LGENTVPNWDCHDRGGGKTGRNVRAFRKRQEEKRSLGKVWMLTVDKKKSQERG